MSWTLRPLLATAALTFSLAACLAQPETPGDTVIGTFRFEPKLVATQETCDFAGVVPLEPFVATLSYDSTSQRAWLTVDGRSREGTLDGARFAVRSEGTRVFECGRDTSTATRCKGVLRERVEGRLVGRLEASDSTSCAEEELNDGTAPADGAGLQDAVLFCGFLTDQLAADEGEGCGCEPCLFVYSLTGRRQ